MDSGDRTQVVQAYTARTLPSELSSQPSEVDFLNPVFHMKKQRPQDLLNVLQANSDKEQPGPSRLLDPSKQDQTSPWKQDQASRPPLGSTALHLGLRTSSPSGYELGFRGETCSFPGVVRWLSSVLGLGWEDVWCEVSAFF